MYYLTYDEKNYHNYSVKSCTILGSEISDKYSPIIDKLRSALLKHCQLINKKCGCDISENVPQNTINLKLGDLGPDLKSKIDVDIDKYRYRLQIYVFNYRSYYVILSNNIDIFVSVVCKFIDQACGKFRVSYRLLNEKNKYVNEAYCVRDRIKLGEFIDLLGISKEVNNIHVRDF